MFKKKKPSASSKAEKKQKHNFGIGFAALKNEDPINFLAVRCNNRKQDRTREGAAWKSLKNKRSHLQISPRWALFLKLEKCVKQKHGENHNVMR